MIIGIAGNAGSGKDTVADHLVKNHGFVKVSLADPLKRICREVFDFSDEQLWGASEERNKPDKRYPQRATHEWERDYSVKSDGPDALRHHYWRCKFCGQTGQERAGSGPPSEAARGDLLSPSCLCLTPRHALQQLGTEWGRACYPYIWVNYALRAANKLLYPGRHRYSYTQQLGVHHHVSHEPKGVVIPDVRFKNEVDAINAAFGNVWKITRPIPRLEGAAGQHQSETELDGIDPKLFHAFIENSSTLEKLYQSVEFCLEKK